MVLLVLSAVMLLLLVLPLLALGLVVVMLLLVVVGLLQLHMGLTAAAEGALEGPACQQAVAQLLMGTFHMWCLKY